MQIKSVTIDDLEDAKILLRDFKVCGNWNGGKSGYGCNQVFQTKELTETMQYGQSYFWCLECYKGIKEDLKC